MLGWRVERKSLPHANAATTDDRSFNLKRQWRLRTTFWLDVALLVSVCVLQTVRLTGLVLHEWLGLVIVVMNNSSNGIWPQMRPNSVSADGKTSTDCQSFRARKHQFCGAI
jgi:hypothetical protein